MPLDGHSYLVAQGWDGPGKALREGAISRPVTVSQKKTLSGIGKDRDEAFPFWDHIFSVAANAIQVTVQGEDDDTDPSRSNTPLDRTSTGIISNRPRKIGISALSESAIPNPTGTGLSIMAMAKREAAKRQLYANFFRGPVLGASEKEPVVRKDQTVTESIAPPTENPQKSSKQITRDDKKRKKKISSDKYAQELKDLRTTRKELKKQRKAKKSKTAKDQEKTKQCEETVKEKGGSECDITTVKRNRKSPVDLEERPVRMKKKKKRKRSEELKNC